MQFHGILRVKFNPYVKSDNILFLVLSCLWSTQCDMLPPHHPSPTLCCKSISTIMVFSAVACWAGKIATQQCQHSEKAQLHYKTALRECVTNVVYGKNYLFPEYSHDPIPIPVTNSPWTLIKHLNSCQLFLQLDYIVITSHLWTLLIWKLEKSFDGCLLERSSHISSCTFYWPSFIQWRCTGNHLVEKVA